MKLEYSLQHFGPGDKYQNIALCGIQIPGKFFGIPDKPLEHFKEKKLHFRSAAFEPVEHSGTISFHAFGEKWQSRMIHFTSDPQKVNGIFTVLFPVALRHWTDTNVRDERTVPTGIV